MYNFPSTILLKRFERFRNSNLQGDSHLRVPKTHILLHSPTLVGLCMSHKTLFQSTSSTNDKKNTNRTQQPWEALVTMKNLSKLCTIRSTAPEKKTPNICWGSQRNTNKDSVAWWNRSCLQRPQKIAMYLKYKKGKKHHKMPKFPKPKLEWKAPI